VGAPICKLFAAWRGITLHDGLATYDETYGYDQHGFWKRDRRQFVVESMRELCKVAEDSGIVLAMQNHGPDVVNRYQDVLSKRLSSRPSATSATASQHSSPSHHFYLA
jgi:sugar phosphate isomerase/epimerase